MSICIAPVNVLEFVTSAKVVPFHDCDQAGRFSARTIAIASEPTVDELKYRQLIDLAVKYNARLLALKKRDIQSRYQKWCQISQAQPGSVESEVEVESYWRNKNLYVRRISARSAESAQVVPQHTEIACLFAGGSSLLITINEMEHRARFDVIESRGKSGYCLDGLDYDLALSQVFSLLKQIEGA